MCFMLAPWGSRFLPSKVGPRGTDGQDSLPACCASGVERGLRQAGRSPSLRAPLSGGSMSRLAALCLALLALPVLAAEPLAGPRRPVHTYSSVARDAATG